MSEPLRILVADDELLARKRLLRLLSAMDDVTVCGECEDGPSVVARVKEGGVDVVLLDIQMPGYDGLEALDLMPDDRPFVVFCTAHVEHAVGAFERDAVDYLLKPVEALRLKKAIERARERIAMHRARSTAVALETPALNRLAIVTKNGIELVDPSRVSHAVLNGELVTIVTLDGEYLSTDPLGDLHTRLPPSTFERVHRKAILNLAHLVRLEPLPTGGYLAHTRTGHVVEVSRQVARDLRRRLGLR
ncbi:MAG: response regulator transcription factor [Polyangiaceae bacterium]|nr:response regulator transcription factor [Polyangiaceae bacterium]